MFTIVIKCSIAFTFCNILYNIRLFLSTPCFPEKEKYPGFFSEKAAGYKKISLKSKHLCSLRKFILKKNNPQVSSGKRKELFHQRALQVSVSRSIRLVRIPEAPRAMRFRFSISVSEKNTFAYIPSSLAQEKVSGCRWSCTG